MLTFILQLEKGSASIAMLLDTIMFMNLCEAYEILPRKVPFESIAIIKVCVNFDCITDYNLNIYVQMRIPLYLLSSNITKYQEK